MYLNQKKKNFGNKKIGKYLNAKNNYKNNIAIAEEVNHVEAEIEAKNTIQMVHS